MQFSSNVKTTTLRKPTIRKRQRWEK